LKCFAFQTLLVRGGGWFSSQHQHPDQELKVGIEPPNCRLSSSLAPDGKYRAVLFENGARYDPNRFNAVEIGEQVIAPRTTGAAAALLRLV
jgi:hypothetical protein